MKSKKGMEQFGALATGVVTLCIVLAVAFMIGATAKQQMSDNGDICATSGTVYNKTVEQCCSTVACTSGTYNTSNYGELSTAGNGTNEIISATATIPGWVPLIILVVIGGFILALVKGFKK